MPGNSTKATINTCWMKRADRIGTDRMSFFLEVKIHKPVTELMVHFVVYKREVLYQKYAVDVWQNICDWLGTKKRSFFMDWTLGRIMKYIKYDGKYECPLLAGSLTVRYTNLSLNEHFPLVPLLPSGRYRFDATITEGNRSIIFAHTEYYITLSDHRIEQY